VVPLVLSTFVCVLLSGRRLALWRLSASVAVSQLLFHGLFILGTTSSAVGSSETGVHAGHTMTVVISTAGMSHHGQESIWMWAAHALAAVVTIGLLHRGETAIAALMGFTGYVVSRVARALSPLGGVPVRLVPAGSSHWFEHRPTPLGVFASVSLQRGPPIFSGS